MFKSNVFIHKAAILLLSLFLIAFFSCQEKEVTLAPSDGLAISKYPADPMASEIITSDIDLFWNAFDLLMKDPSSNPFQKHYIEKGSQGVIDFLPDQRIINAEELKKLVLAEKEYYANIRSSSYKSLEYEKQTRASNFALKHLYPDAVFPPIYFIIGRTSSGATATENGLVVAIEVFSEKKYWTNYGRPSLKLDLLPFIIAHEIIHFLQIDDPNDSTLLKQCIREGSADFISELTSGEKVKLLNGDNVYPYGDQHEEALWNEFKLVMDGIEISPWLYSQTADGRPQNLGYWMGYKIVEAYYNKASDKKKAIADILNIRDYHDFLINSGYQEKFN